MAAPCQNTPPPPSLYPLWTYDRRVHGGNLCGFCLRSLRVFIVMHIYFVCTVINCTVIRHCIVTLCMRTRVHR